jgi:tetratricopeptide (TPR) repeat protein
MFLRMNRNLLSFCILAWLLVIQCAVNAQPYATIDLDKTKPKNYETRSLRSEKTGAKKLTVSKRLFQNAFTHYNYYFNANNKINDIIDRAKASNRDDYTKVLSFYNYSLDATSRETMELDSVVYKCTAGILLHDLRNDWIDNLYLLLGKAYLLRKNYDSAGYVFQYINYAWAPKDDGYDIILGSNASNTNGVFTVATNEKKSLLKQVFSTSPSRNESLLWEARNYLEQDKIGSATGLLSILRSDPVFPKRLQTDLHELIAYNYYKQQVYDSAAWHLNKALSNADGRFETARWEYLCGQLYQLANNKEAAVTMFEKSVNHTTDPVMEVYARLNIVNLSSSKKGSGLQDNLNELYKLAKREKYISYRDIIYYSAAILELKQNNIAGAKAALAKSLSNSTDNTAQKQTSFLLLGDINYDIKNYQVAYSNYDSIQTALLLPNDKERVDNRLPALKIVSGYLSTIASEDSLQKIARLPVAERTALVKKILRKLRKEAGLKELTPTDFNDNNPFAVVTTPVGLFDKPSTEFYFANAGLKQKGFNEFKAKWGVRQNVDNWQRISTTNNNNTLPILSTDIDEVAAPVAGEKGNTPKDLTFEGLMGDIPLQPYQLDSSNLNIANAYFNNGVILQNELQDYASAISAYDSLVTRFPLNKNREQALYNLIFCYNFLGLTAKADAVTQALKTGYPKGKYTAFVVNGISNKDAATTTYQNVYNLFLEGQFEKAKEAKKAADSSLGKSYWTPQLLYIEAIYYVKQQEDSIAINRLQSLSTAFPKSPLADKAVTMVDVLKRRQQIERHLTNYNEEKQEEAIAKRVDLSDPTSTKVVAPVIKTDSMVKAPTVIAKPIEVKIEPKPIISEKKTFQFVPTDQHFAAIVLDKVDETFAGEVKNAFNRFNKERYYNQKLDMTTANINNQFSIVLIGPFANAGDAVDYIDKTKPSAAGRIVPWLQASKYSFSIISNSNLDLIKADKDVVGYTQFLKGIFPDKF